MQISYMRIIEDKVKTFRLTADVSKIVNYNDLWMRSFTNVDEIILKEQKNCPANKKNVNVISKGSVQTHQVLMELRRLKKQRFRYTDVKGS